MDMEMNIIKLNYNMKENIYMEKEMEKEKNIVWMVSQYLKENFSKEKDGMEEEKNIIQIMKLNLKKKI